MIHKPGVSNSIRLADHCREFWKRNFILPDVVLGERDRVEIIFLIRNSEYPLRGLADNQISAGRSVFGPWNLSGSRCFTQDSLRTKSTEFLFREPLKFPMEKDRTLDLVEALQNEVEECLSQ